ncbi:MAG: hypothetical protein A2Y49_02125 [Candidatus Zambryskibacteria bacterium RIFCSPLOWO2_12_39_8]|uniref:FecR protein domain-containing protein n=1 Tax=Candidatus Zambryskibacteria bacterium RIFCSPLOWO2_12_39_8 TaxID=1802774 RepID=A0A1G2UWK9_9BACT|nr:MAG: hypothetical protein A2Y49_02125 [Candidatus Zambryskibacteria bacterium RIFCSPLOWO2_12_39_8]
MSRLIIIPIILAVILAGVYAIFKYGTTVTQPLIKATEIKEAWIEVVNGPIFNKTSLQKVELKSGDLITIGATIETDSTSRGHIHFPDGSVLRLDKATTITVSEIHFKKDDHSLAVKIALVTGRVWSKVITLATPESVWEVKTGNTVATVRGTAFSMSYKNGVSFIFGSENKIAVAPIDPVTKEAIKLSEVVIGENKVIEITLKEVEKARVSDKPVLNDNVREATPAILNDGWVQDSKEKDREFDLEIEELKLNMRGGDIAEEIIERTEENRKIFNRKERDSEDEKDDSVEQKKPVIKIDEFKRKTEIKNKVEVEKSDTLEAKIPRVNRNTLEPKIEMSQRETGGSSGSSDNTSGEMRIITDKGLTLVLEGETIVFKAILENQTTKRDITSLVTWNVIGDIGNIIRPGVFVAKLGDEVSELGESVGYVVASFENSKEVGKSELIKVEALVPDTSEEIGG